MLAGQGPGKPHADNSLQPLQHEDKGDQEQYDTFDQEQHQHNRSPHQQVRAVVRVEEVFGGGSDGVHDTTHDRLEEQYQGQAQHGGKSQQDDGEDDHYLDFVPHQLAPDNPHGLAGILARLDDTHPDRVKFRQGAVLFLGLQYVDRIFQHVHNIGPDAQQEEKEQQAEAYQRDIVQEGHHELDNVVGGVDQRVVFKLKGVIQDDVHERLFGVAIGDVSGQAEHYVAIVVNQFVAVINNVLDGLFLEDQLRVGDAAQDAPGQQLDAPERPAQHQQDQRHHQSLGQVEPVDLFEGSVGSPTFDTLANY